jgi:hypothetical protein
MIAKIIFAIILFVAAVIAAPVVGENFSIVVADIPDNDIGTVRANCHNNGDGTFVITIDEAFVNSPDYNVIIFHEMGHVYHWEDWSEEDCDNFANAQGVGYIHDTSY